MAGIWKTFVGKNDKADAVETHVAESSIRMTKIGGGGLDTGGGAGTGREA